MTHETMVQILHVPDCPLVDRLIDAVERCLAEAGVGEPVEVVVGDYPSPTLVIGGVDVATGRPVEGEPRCRMDLPSQEQIRAAVRELSS
ncbi:MULTISPECIES: alkylmercury lyase [Nocardioides]|uniref:Alkylmercury lyase n=1 Tax=Nocardioides vastitatis TaxID=2568655 RepID=A0ABW0ZLM1_9ACTN|nr:alkylmercury lyase [Nocardioides sp.]THJ01621.1 alkylmercury lyase [Nocardioides sp.]